MLKTDEDVIGALYAYALNAYAKKGRKYGTTEARDSMNGVERCLYDMAEFYAAKGFLGRRQIEYARRNLTIPRLRSLSWKPMKNNVPKDGVVSGRYAFIAPRRTVRLEINEKDLISEIKGMAGATYSKKEGTWFVTMDLPNLQMLEAMGFRLDSELKKWMKSVLPSSTATADITIEGLNADLRDYQRFAVSFIESRGGRALIADDMGLGKALETLAFLEKAQAWPAIIVCPSAVKYNWANEFKKFLPQRTFQVIEGLHKEGDRLEDVDAWIVNYDVLPDRTVRHGQKEYHYPGWASIFVKSGAVTAVLDEGHLLKNPKTGRAKATKTFAKKTENVVVLTGTPIENRPIEAFTICNIVSPKLFPSFTEYKLRYCNPTKGLYGTSYNGASNVQELHKKLTSTIMLRRMKDDVLKDLPPKTRMVIPVKIDLREYRKAEAGFLSWVAGADIGANTTRVSALARIEALKQIAAKAKIKPVCEWIDEYLETGRKLLLFGHHLDVIDTVYERYEKHAVKITGATPSKEKFRLAEKFNDDKNINIAVGGILPMGTGLNMQGGDASAFLELAWTPGKHDQAEDRARRMNTTKPIFAYYMLAMDTIDIDIAEILDSKRSMISQIMDGKDIDDDSVLLELLKRYKHKALKAKEAA